MKTTLNPVQRACEEVGGQAELARLVGTSPAFVSQWINDTRPVPPKYCVAIERVTQVTRKDLRPDDYFDIWPEIDDRKKLRRHGDAVRAAIE